MGLVLWGCEHPPLRALPNLLALRVSVVFSNVLRIILFWLLCREHGPGLRNAKRLKSRCSRVVCHLLFLYHSLPQSLSDKKRELWKTSYCWFIHSWTVLAFRPEAGFKPLHSYTGPRVNGHELWGLGAHTTGIPHKSQTLPASEQEAFWGALVHLVSLIAPVILYFLVLLIL